MSHVNHCMTMSLWCWINKLCWRGCECCVHPPGWCGVRPAGSWWPQLVRSRSHSTSSSCPRLTAVTPHLATALLAPAPAPAPASPHLALAVWQWWGCSCAPPAVSILYNSECLQSSSLALAPSLPVSSAHLTPVSCHTNHHCHWRRVTFSSTPRTVSPPVTALYCRAVRYFF